MLEILKKTWKTGIVTIQYPDRPNHTSPGFRGKPEILADKCAYCGECVKACPPGVISINNGSSEKALTISYSGCIFCGRCEEVCPYDAIRLTQEYEIASKKKDDLLTTVRRKL